MRLEHEATESLLLDGSRGVARISMRPSLASVESPRLPTLPAVKELIFHYQLSRTLFDFAIKSLSF